MSQIFLKKDFRVFNKGEIKLVKVLPEHDSPLFSLE